MTHYKGWDYTYDAQNRLRLAHNNGVQIAEFYYDGKNRQIARNINGIIRFSVWDGWELIEEYASSTSRTTAYLQGATGVIKSWGNNGTIYYYQDKLGSTTHVANASGALLETFHYDLYGTPLNPSTYNIVDLYAGERWISELGLYDLRNRFMSPELGRFLQADPISFKGDASNLYRYCHNDPENFSDPMGLISVDVTWSRLMWMQGGAILGFNQILEAYLNYQPAGTNGGAGRDGGIIMAGQYKVGPANGGEATIEKSRRILAQQTKEGEDSTGAIVDGKPVPGDHIRGKQVPYRFGKPVYAPSGNSVLAARKILYIAEPLPPGRSDALSHYHTRTGFTAQGVSLAEPSVQDMRALKTTGAMLFSNPHLKAEGAYRIYRNGVPSYETRHDLYNP